MKLNLPNQACGSVLLSFGRACTASLQGLGEGHSVVVGGLPRSRGVISGLHGVLCFLASRYSFFSRDFRFRGLVGTVFRCLSGVWMLPQGCMKGCYGV